MRATAWTFGGLVCGMLVVGLGFWAVLLCLALGHGDPGRRVTPEFLLWLLIVATPGAINGAIGAIDGLRSGQRRNRFVWVVPLLLPLVALVAAVVFQDPKTPPVGFLAMGTVWALITWIAGRIGEEIGVAGRRFPNRPPTEAHGLPPTGDPLSR